MFTVTIVNLVALGAIFPNTKLSASVLIREEISFPSIRLKGYSDWTNISIPSIQRRVFYTKDYAEWSVQCIAPYPIQWNFTGKMEEGDWELSSYGKKEGYKIQVYLNPTFASLKVTCEKVADTRVKDELYIFINYRTNGTLIKKVDSVTNSKVLPCLTLDPRQDVKLYIKTSDNKTTPVSAEDTTLRYNPVEGFVSANVFDGEYICRQNSSTVSLEALTTISDDYTFLPGTNNISVFSENSIRFECLSKQGKRVQIKISEEKAKVFGNLPYNFTVHRNFIDDNHGTLELSYNLTHRISMKGTASCVTNSPDNGEEIVLHKWSYKYIGTPKLRFDNSERLIMCMSLYDIKLSTFPCKTSVDCGFLMTHCQKNMVRCDFVFSTTEQYRSLIFKDAQHSKDYSYSHGIMQCRVEGLVKQWQFFESLSYRKYINWKVVPERELIRLDETPHILYTNETSQFFCEASYYLFRYVLQFNIVFRNESTMPLEDNEETVNIFRDYVGSRLITSVNIIEILDVRLPIDAVGMQCIATFRNSTDFLVTERQFQTRHLHLPKLESGYDGSKIHKTLFNGEINQRLACPAKGEPTVKYTWLFNNSTLSEMFPELKTNSGPNGESYLEFPNIQQPDSDKYAGEYKCIAMNRLGCVEQSFYVNVSDKPIGGNVLVYSVIGVVGVIFITTSIIAVLIYRRRYNIAQKLLRDLTNGEIDEFFQGRQELVGNTANAETVEFQPYNKDYEIPFEDLEFTSSGTNLLGSGEFAVVVRGLVKSQGKPVAIKIPKPSTDVTIFKTLLSEVKIMIYIGSHENVMSLIGACKEEIKNRHIYIATEICYGGCLSKLLINSRSSFINLMNANQEIDLSLLNEQSSNQVSTLDLISFAAQIANGMEYLAYKKIIHADLAARNVLLTESKVAKITDFGLSKKLYESGNYVKKSRTPLPWRWMALESLTTMTFSTSSDVWAYGVTLFEIFSLGEIPFPNETWSNSFVERLASGMRMGRPKFATQEIYYKIGACWEEDPEIRPSFTTLRSFFQELLGLYRNNTNSEEAERSEPVTDRDRSYITL